METDQDYHIAVFPFLKTTKPVQIGHLLFRSTDDTSSLPANKAESVHEISQMLFLNDNLRIKSASYAMIPEGSTQDQLKNVQAVVAYCYAAPRHEFGDLFLPPENASVAVFSPGKVPLELVCSRFHTEAVQPMPNLPTEHDMIQGYEGLYNFKHHFWVAKGSRLYGPIPNLTLNISQDLSNEFNRNRLERVDYKILGDVLQRESNQMNARIFTAVRWFNLANSNSNDQAAAIVDLSIAFESLLSLPSDEKTDRLVDAISLLLGRTPRLDNWARQFYDARSSVVHEGSSVRLHFLASDHPGSKGEKLPYQSLLVYGRRVFQLCLGTLLVGAELAAGARLEETLVTNEERFVSICKILQGNDFPVADRLRLIAPIVAAVNRNLYVPEPKLQRKTMLSAARNASKVLLESGNVLAPEITALLTQFADMQATDNQVAELDLLMQLENALKQDSGIRWVDDTRVVQDLLHLVWHYTWAYYFHMKKPTLAKSQGGKTSAT